jgi:hypothetical protein
MDPPRITLAELGRPVQKRRSGHARAVPGCHHRPAARRTYPTTVRLCRAKMSKRGAHPCPEGNCGGNTRPAAGGERTPMGPSTTSRRPQKRLTPMRMLRRTNGRNVGELAYDRADMNCMRSRVLRSMSTGAPPPEAPPWSSQRLRRRCLAAAVPAEGSLMPPSSHEPTEWGIGREYPTWCPPSDRQVGPLGGNDETSGPNRPQRTP